MNHEENVLDLDAQEYWRQRAMSAMHENDAIQQENRDEIDRLRRRCKDLQFECGMMRAGTADIIRQYILAYQKKREANQQRLQGELDLNKSRLAQAISALKNPPTSGKPQSVTPGTVARLKGSIKRIMRELAANDPETIPVDVVLKQLYHFSDGLIEDVVSKRKRNRRHADDDEEVEDAAAGEEDGVDDGRDDSEGSEPSSPPIQRRRDDLGNAFVKARIKRPARVRNRRVGQGETAHVVGTRSGSVASTASSADQEDERPVQVAQENTLEPVNGALAEATYENPDGRLLGNPVQTQGEAVNLLDAQQQHYDASTVPLVENGYADPSQPQEQQQQQEELNHVEFAEEPHAAAEHHTEDYPEQYRQEEGVEVQSMPQREELYVEREHNNWEQVMMEAEAEAEAAADNAAEQTYDYEPAMDSLSNALRETPGVTHHVQHVAISTGPTFEEQVTETDDEAQQSATVPATTTTAAPLTPVTAVTQSLQTLRVSTVSPISTPLPTMQADPVNTTQASQPVQPRTPSRIGRCRNARTSPAPRHSSPRLPPPQSSAFYRTTAPLQSWHRMMKRTRAQYEGWEPLDTSDAEDGDENVTTVKAPRAIRSVAGVASHTPNGGALQRQNSAHTLRDDEETSRRTAQDSEDEFLRQPLPPSHFLAYHMFANSYQAGFLSILYSIGSKPLQIWDTNVRNGHIKRITDEDIQSSVLELIGSNVSTCFISCPAEAKKTLGIKLPFLVMIIKNVKKYFSFEVTILDDKGIRRRFRASNYQSTTRAKPFVCTMPMRLDEGWNQIQFNLSDFTRRAYGTNYLETLRVQVHANCRIRRLYFSDRLYSEDELPPEFKLFLPVSRGQQQQEAEHEADARGAPSSRRAAPAGAGPAQKSARKSPVPPPAQAHDVNDQTNNYDSADATAAAPQPSANNYDDAGDQGYASDENEQEAY